MLACLYTSDCMFVKFSMKSLLQITMDTYSVFDVRNGSIIVLIQFHEMLESERL